MGLRGKIFLGVLAAYILLVALVQLYFGNAIRAVLIQNADGFAANGFAQTRRGVERLVEQV
ncbi:MAG: hypothetical protein GX558_01230, partial [Clostridiales bacterium]|nr:hypothetical protein [Clostridiales bacterium]